MIKSLNLNIFFKRLEIIRLFVSIEVCNYFVCNIWVFSIRASRHTSEFLHSCVGVLEVFHCKKLRYKSRSRFTQNSRRTHTGECSDIVHIVFPENFN